MRILVIEDEEGLRTQIQTQLRAQGYEIDGAKEGKEGLYLATEYLYDVAIVDLGLPNLSGIEVIQRLRAQGKTLPILILTARSRWQNKVEGLEAGADDYLVKPFQMEELLARIKALLRRAAGGASALMQCGAVTLDTLAQKVSVNDTEIELTAFEYRLLEYLMRHRSKVVSKSELTDYLYAHDDDRDSNTLEVFIGRLRRKLDPNGDVQPIETLRGRGYRFTLG